MNKIIEGDCIEVMKELQDNSIDLVATDPPYFVARKEFIKDIKTFDEYYSWFESWIKELKRVLKPTGSLYVFVPVFNFAELHMLVKKYFIGKQFISWIKPNTMVRQFQTKNYFPKTEFIGFYTVDEKEYTWNCLFKKYGVQESCNYFIEPVVYSYMKEGVNHSTQKPLSIIERFIYASSNENDIVLDPFCGSGTTGVACVKLNRNFIGYDINPEYVELTKKRLEKTTPKQNVGDWF